MTFSYTMALHAGVSPMRNCDIHEGMSPARIAPFEAAYIWGDERPRTIHPVHPSCGGS
jgi:hypothetical protein